MLSFLICFVILIIGYLTYGKLVENTFGPDDRETPAVTMNDGVDYVVLPQWKLFLIQLLNIAGLGPIFGAVGGALWGPVVFLWITFGTIFAGAVHDFFAGMTSIRHKGASITEVCGFYLGDTMKTVMRVFAVVLLVMVGTVFASGPAGLIVMLFKKGGFDAATLVASPSFWLAVIFIYYFIATFVPIDAIIGRVYPVFGICLIVMAIGVGCGILFGSHGSVPEIWTNFGSMHPKGTPIWAFMFITVACGAISGFHATQSPLMARCMKSERQGRFVFYGAMVCEGIIALIWAAASCAMYDIVDGQTIGLAKAGAPAAVVYDICTRTMGGIGTTLAMLGVVVCPITSGDTAFRSARLVLADWFGVPQGQWKNRLLFAIPLFAVGIFLSQIDFTIVWRYFSWTNQTLAMIVLWTASMYLFRNKKNYWLTAVPATFMSAVSATYFCMAPECLGMVCKMPAGVAYVIGIIVAVVFLGLFIRATKRPA